MRFLSIAILSLISTSIFAQPKQNSPYSRYGIGDPVSQYFASQTGMGRLATASNDAYHLNFQNPASFAFLRSTALETGLYAKYSQYSSGTQNLNAWSGNLNYLALGFTLKSPINEALDRKKSPWQFGAGFAVSPYSLVGYSVKTKDVLPQLGLVTNNFEGTGGLYKTQIAAAAKHKHSAFGLSIGWIFGKSSWESYTRFQESNNDPTPGFITAKKDELRVRGFTARLGLQHNFILKTDVNDKELPTQWVTVGAFGEAPHSLDGTAQILQLRARNRTEIGTYVQPDTISFSKDQEKNIQLPAAFGLGAMFVKRDKLKLGFEYTLENWSNYENELRPERMRNTNAVSAGFEVIPNAAAYNNYLERIRYRFGLYYQQDPRLVDNQEINDFGATLGLGFPIILPRQGVSFLNAALEVGKSGGGTPVSEFYYRLTVGFTLNDNSWFYKRRFE